MAHPPQLNREDYASTKIIEHACRELGLTKAEIGRRFGVDPIFISSDHIRTLWLEKLRSKK